MCPILIESKPHWLDCIIWVVEGNEGVSYVNRGQAVLRLDCCTKSNTLGTYPPSCEAAVRLTFAP